MHRGATNDSADNSFTTKQLNIQLVLTQFKQTRVETVTINKFTS